MPVSQPNSLDVSQDGYYGDPLQKIDRFVKVVGILEPGEISLGYEEKETLAMEVL